MLLNVLPRFALTLTQITNILNVERRNNNISASLTDIAENTYLITEQYIGDGTDDIISFHTIDHGVIPNPDLGLENLDTKKSAERCVQG